MSTPETHPTRETLAMYAVDRLPDAEAREVRRHLFRCAECRAFVESAPASQVIDALKPAGKAKPTPDPTERIPAIVATPPRDTEVPPELQNHPRYRIIRPLGHGGMGTVYLAEHELMGRQVAVKVINPMLLDHPEASSRFLSEVKAAAKLDHPNIIRAFDAEVIGSTHLFVMEYVDGPNLDAYLAHKVALPVTQACAVVRQTAEALQHAHEKGMVHRDVKPANLMITPTGQVKLGDFGLAKMASERRTAGGDTSANVLMGTPDYIAPEQAMDARSSDIRADIYSLGCTLFALLTGRPPFVGKTPLQVVLQHLDDAPPKISDFRLDVPPAVAELLARMLAKTPDERPRTPKEVADALRPFCGAAESVIADAAAVAGAPPLLQSKPRLVVMPVRLTDRPEETMATSLASALGPATRLPERAVIKPRRKKATTPEDDDEDEKQEDRGPKSVSTSSTRLPNRNKSLHNWQQRKLRQQTHMIVAGVVAVVVLVGVGILIAVSQGDAPRQPEPEPRAFVPTRPPTPTPRPPVGTITPTVTPTPTPDPPFAEPRLPGLAPADTTGFIPLFNGRDLGEWQVLTGQTGGTWKVTDGAIVGEGGNSLLVHRNAGFDDYHLRTEAMIEGGEAGLCVRYERDTPDDTSFHPGYEVPIWPSTAHGKATGYLMRQGPSRVFPPAVADVANRLPTANGEWFALEVIAVGPRVTVAVNGRVTADVVDTEDGPVRGRIALRQSSPGTRVRFRRVELKGIRTPPTIPTADGFTPLFNAKDLSGWSPIPASSQEWTVENGAIVGRGSDSVLASHRAYGNFQLRARAMLEQGHGGIMLRYGSTTVGTQLERAAYEARIWEGHEVGRVLQFPPLRYHQYPRTGSPLVKGQWFDMQVQVQGPRVQVWVDGNPTADVTDGPTWRRRGLVTLHTTPAALVRFQKVEIRELAPTPGTVPIGDFQPLFNGRSLFGWRSIPHFPGEWTVNQATGVMAVLAGGRMGGLFADATYYTDYHLYCEFRGELRFEGRSPLKVDEPYGFHAYAPSGIVVNNRTKSQHNPKQAAYTPSRDGWDRFELVAKGEQVTAYINGEERGSFIDTDPRARAYGGLMLGTLIYPTGRVPGTVEIRRLEIRRYR